MHPQVKHMPTRYSKFDAAPAYGAPAARHPPGGRLRLHAAHRFNKDIHPTGEQT
jgi:hypothetical protein